MLTFYYNNYLLAFFNTLVDECLETDSDSESVTSIQSTPESTSEINCKDDVNQIDDLCTDTNSLISHVARTMDSSCSTVFSAAQLAKFRNARCEEMFPDEVSSIVKTIFY